MAPASSLRVLLTDRAWPDTELERRLLAACGAELIEAPSGDEETLCRLAADANAIGVTWAQATERVIQSAPRLKVVARYGIGLDNIAVEEATRRGIVVTNVPDYCVTEVAEHVLALAFAAARNVAFFHLRTKAGEYSLAAGPPMRRLEGRVLGLLGFGKIARQVARRAEACGFRVLAHSRSKWDFVPGVEAVSFDRLAAESDFLSVHVPLTEATRGMLGYDQFARMKPTAWLINTARGAILDADGLWRALQEGKLAGACLDVFLPEPPDLAHPLYRDERVIVTPHAAFLSVESLQELRSRATQSIVDVLCGRTPRDVVNPQVLAKR